MVTLDADPESVASLIFALGDGLGLQLLSDPDWDARPRSSVGAPDRAPPARRLRAVTHVTDLPPVDPLDWLAGQPARQRESACRQRWTGSTAFLERRRWLVLAALARAPAWPPRPFAAMRQTEHLTSGGFTVPGLGLRGRRPRRSPTSRAPSARRSPWSSPAARARPPPTCAPQVDRVDAVAAELPHVELSDRAAAAGQARARRESPIVIATARRAAAPRTRPPTWPSTCARSSASARAPRDGVAALPGRPAGAVGRHAGPLQGGPRVGRDHRLPDRAADPAGGVRLAGRRGPAAGAGLRQRDASPARPSSSSPRRPTCRCSSPTSPR